MMAASHDGGASFIKDRRIIPAGPGYFGITGVARSNGFPQIGIGPRPANANKGRAAGSLYVSWSDYSNGDVDIFVSSSADQGETWSAPVRVNNDPLHSGADQFFQWMSVDPQSGAVNLVFYDRRPDNARTSVTLARSIDGGKTFENYALDQESFEAEGDFLGDYTAITSFANKVWAAWAHQTSETTSLTGTRKTRTMLRVGRADFN